MSQLQWMSEEEYESESPWACRSAMAAGWQKALQSAAVEQLLVVESAAPIQFPAAPP